MGNLASLSLILLFLVSSLFSREIDLFANINPKLLRAKGPKPVEKASSPYFVRILKRKPNYATEDGNDAEVESIPRILIKSSRRFPILVKSQALSVNEKIHDMEVSSSAIETMEGASSSLSQTTTTTFLPLLGQILSVATAQDSSVSFANSSQAPSIEPPPIVPQTTASQQLQLNSTEESSVDTPIPTTEAPTTTTSSSTTTTTTPTTTTTTTKSSLNNIRVVHTNNIEVLTFPSTGKPSTTVVTTLRPRTTTTIRPWTLFQPINNNNNQELENNPFNAILAAPGNFLVGVFKGFQQATEFVGDTISGFANLLLPNKN